MAVVSSVAGRQPATIRRSPRRGNGREEGRVRTLARVGAYSAPQRATEEAAGPRSIDLDALSAHWRVAFNSAEDALRAARFSLAAPELREHRHRLELERNVTARLLDSLAREAHTRLVHRVAAPRASNRMLGLPPEVLACVFDLDGVLTASAAVHAAAWTETLDEFLLGRAERTGGRFAPFNPRTDYQEHIHGKPRLDGVRAFLASRGIRLPEGAPDDPAGAKTVQGLANRKNEALLRRLEARGVTAFEGSRRYLEAAREAGLHCAVVSSSANTRLILERAGLAGLVEQRVDGNTIRAGRLRAKPAPDTLLAACRQLGVRPHEAVVFETAPAGIAAGRAAGFDLIIGVDRTGHADGLRPHGADLAVSDLAELLDPALGV